MPRASTVFLSVTLALAGCVGHTHATATRSGLVADSVQPATVPLDFPHPVLPAGAFKPAAPAKPRAVHVTPAWSAQTPVEPAVARALPPLRASLSDKLAEVARVSFSNTRGKIVSNNGASIIANNGGSVVANNGASVVANNGASIIANNGGSVVANNGASAAGGYRLAARRVLALPGAIQASPLAGEAAPYDNVFLGLGRQLLFRRDNGDVRTVAIDASGRAYSELVYRNTQLAPDGLIRSQDQSDLYLIDPGKLAMATSYHDEVGPDGLDTHLTYTGGEFIDTAAGVDNLIERLNYDLVAGVGDFALRYVGFAEREVGTLNHVALINSGVVTVLTDPLAVYPGESRIEGLDGQVIYRRVQSYGDDGVGKRRYDLLDGMALDLTASTDDGSVYDGRLLLDGKPAGQVHMAVSQERSGDYGTTVFQVQLGDRPNELLVIRCGPGGVTTATQPLPLPGASPSPGPTAPAASDPPNGGIGLAPAAGCTWSPYATPTPTADASTGPSPSPSPTPTPAGASTGGASAAPASPLPTYSPQAAIPVCVDFWPVQSRHLAGGGTGAFADGDGPAARFNQPSGLGFYVDANGQATVYVADTLNHRVRALGYGSNRVRTFVGSGVAGSQDGRGPTAQLNGPAGIAVASSGELYVSESLGHRIRRIDPDGTTHPLAGSGQPGYSNGPGPQAFNGPSGLALAADGHLYVADSLNHCIRQITLNPDGSAAALGTVAGNGQPGYADGAAGFGGPVRFNQPAGLAYDRASDVLYVADSGNHCVRAIAHPAAAAPVVTTYAGSPTAGVRDAENRTNARFITPVGLALDAQGRLYVTDTDAHQFRLVLPDGRVRTLMGSGRLGSGEVGGYLDSVGRFTTPTALFVFPWGLTGLALDAGTNRLDLFQPVN